MKRFIKHFRRDPLGVWICQSPTEVALPQGRIRVTLGSRFAPGTTFMNIDVAQLLEGEYERLQGRPH